ncbi:MAG: type II toxin-antitoxin system ParD family antitoxin [Candidatus Moraniibacteriota bacterium]
MKTRMKIISISLPGKMALRVKERASEFGNVSDYIRTLIREDQKRKDEEKLEKLLLDGLASGFVQIEDWKHFKEDMLQKLKQ